MGTSLPVSPLAFGTTSRRYIPITSGKAVAVQIGIMNDDLTNLVEPLPHDRQGVHPEAAEDDQEVKHRQGLQEPKRICQKKRERSTVLCM